MGTTGEIKLSVTLPNGAQVSIESDDRELVLELFYSTLPQLVGPMGLAGDAEAGTAVASRSNGLAQIPLSDAAQKSRVVSDEGNEPGVPQSGTAINGAVGSARSFAGVSSASADASPNRAGDVEMKGVPSAGLSARNGTVEPATPVERDYAAFCQDVSPLGDMRRVVVAAEAADRYLSVKSVDPDGLAHLFGLAGWPQPHSFVQTLRNAARTKFRWLERIPGQSGHYRVTNTGRSIVLGDNTVSPAASVDTAYGGSG